MGAGGEGMPFILLERAGLVVLGETLGRVKITTIGTTNKTKISNTWGKTNTTVQTEINSKKEKKRPHLHYQERMHGEMHQYATTSINKTNIRRKDS